MEQYRPFEDTGIAYVVDSFDLGDPIHISEISEISFSQRGFQARGFYVSQGFSVSVPQRPLVKEILESSYSVKPWARNYDDLC